MMKTLLWFLPLAMMGAACSPPPLYEQTFESACWDKSDTLRMTIPKGEPAVLELTFGAEFAYRNFFLQVESGGESFTLTDTLLDEGGNWLLPMKGDKVVWRSENLPVAGDIRLYHYMRTEQMCEVYQVRLLSGEK